MVKKIHATAFGGPAKAKSNFMLYGDEVRPKIMADLRAEHGDAFKITMAAGKIGEMWKTVSEEKKKELSEQAAKLKVEYEEKMKAWQLTKEYQEFVRVSANNKQKLEMKAERTKAKESGMPTQPMSAYMAFSMEKTPGVIAQLKAEGKMAKMTDRSAMIKAQWDALGAWGSRRTTTPRRRPRRSTPWTSRRGTRPRRARRSSRSSRTRRRSPRPPRRRAARPPAR